MTSTTSVKHGGCARCGSTAQPILTSYLFTAKVEVVFAKLPQTGPLAVCAACQPKEGEATC